MTLSVHNGRFISNSLVGESGAHLRELPWSQADTLASCACQSLLRDRYPDCLRKNGDPVKEQLFKDRSKLGVADNRRF